MSKRTWNKKQIKRGPKKTCKGPNCLPKAFEWSEVLGIIVHLQSFFIRIMGHKLWSFPAGHMAWVSLMFASLMMALALRSLPLSLAASDDDQSFGWIGRIRMRGTLGVPRMCSFKLFFNGCHLGTAMSPRSPFWSPPQTCLCQNLVGWSINHFFS